MFFDVFKALCDQRELSVYKAAQQIGLNRSVIAKYKKGSRPNGASLSAMSSFFGKSADFILGLTPDSHVFVLENKLQDAKKQLDETTDPDKIAELQVLIDGLTESLEDIRLTDALAGTKKAPAESGEGEEYNAAFLGGVDDGMSEEERALLWDDVQSFAELRAAQIRKARKKGT